MDIVQYIEVATSFILGIAIVVLSCWLFKIKNKGFWGIIINAIMGCVILIAFNLFGIVTLPLNPFNALITGIFGIFGVVLIYLIIMFL